MDKVPPSTDKHAYPFSNPLPWTEKTTEGLPRRAEGVVEGPLPDIPSEDSKMSGRQISHAHLNEWSGDTLVESEAQAFLHKQRLQRVDRQNNAAGNGDLAITRKRRLFPSLRSGMSPSQIHVRDRFPSPEECEALISAGQRDGVDPPQPHGTIDNHQVVRNDSPDPRTRSLSNETVKLHPSEQQKESSTSPVYPSPIAAHNRSYPKIDT